MIEPTAMLMAMATTIRLRTEVVKSRDRRPMIASRTAPTMSATR